MGRSLLFRNNLVQKHPNNLVRGLPPLLMLFGVLTVLYQPEQRRLRAVTEVRHLLGLPVVHPVLPLLLRRVLPLV